MTRSFALVLSTLVTLAFTSLPVAAQQPAKALTVEDIFAHGPLIGTPPQGLAWSPDGRHLTYLDAGELIEVEMATGKSRVMIGRAKLASLDGAPGSETDRDHRERYKMGSYFWTPDSNHLLFDFDGRLWLYDLKAETGVKIGSTGMESGDDPKFSPDGEWISFLRDHGLATMRIKNIHTRASFSRPSFVAPAPRNSAILNGEVDWVYLEELETRSNYFWSPDSKRLAYLEMNEQNVPLYPITDWIPTHASVDAQRYPQAGDPNPSVRVGVVSAEGGRTVWMKLPFQAGQDYIPRFGWVSPHTLWIETLARDQKRRAVYFADAKTGQSRLALEITDDRFLDDNYDVEVGDGSIVLAQWSDGHNHLYLYRYDPSVPGAAKLERQLTEGDFDVAEISRVDFAGRTVNYASNEGNPLGQQLWQVNFDGQRKPLAAEPGRHEGNFAPSGPAFVDTCSARLSPPTLRLCEQPGNCHLLWQTHALDAYHLRPPEQLEVKAGDGTILYATLLLPESTGAASVPPASVPPASVPLIVNPYGGPAVQGVADRWQNGLLFDELLAQHGFAVLHADNRGAAMRGRAFAQAASHDLGRVQFQDQLTVVDAVLAKYPRLDAKRLGWWGWSFGGSFTLYAMTHSDRFRAGVAVAPVTDWRNYDSVYTERYLGLPGDFPADYKAFSVVNSAADLKGRILLVQGTGDDNVHMSNSIQFVQKLIEAGIPYDLQLYPRKTHSIAGGDVRTHLYNRILAHFEQYLEPVPQP